MKLSNNTILITGGTSGIGKELAGRLLKRNNKVILLGRNAKKLEAAAKEGFHTLLCDVSKMEDIENVVENIKNNFPDLSILFNNAGVQYNYLFKDMAIPLENIAQEMGVNSTGQLMLTQRLIPLLCSQKKAMIINTTSGLGAFPKTDGLVYSASKAALRNFTTGLRLTLKNTSVKVLEFIPPVTDTPMTSCRNGDKMPAQKLVALAIPQIEKEKRIVTVPKMRIFLWVSFLMPKLAHKILSK
ncbi:short-subunit dehydrogenase involved in D-alanine esterification of teichoic acids [Saonia flava]|uniref:Short-subunit dehydrogenase involved in D-alanine esterification of teichoic acids n=1 Tax=Saonia flava TaxID=523696 RepID=A0A846QPX4_9FLAO|nr:SDR family NAD(P)-dependent oxidoreductase [Saonia flava]NJB71096.1 short-subunit dehydrogenase involved in D-alanine esterification of teichoic acids [Saonia flava]